MFLAGAGGVIGSRLVPLLVAARHEVIAFTRTPSKAPSLERAGASVVVGDVYDLESLADSMEETKPDVILHELTDLPDDPSRLGQARSANARIRVEGTDNLLEAARRAGVGRIVAQSVAWAIDDPVGRHGVAHLESAVLESGGVVLRYGQFYGPGTYHATPPPPPRIHIDEAAERTVELLDSPTGTYLVTEERDP